MESGSTEEMEEQGFRLVVLLMGGYDASRPRFHSYCFEKSIADITESLLEIIFREYLWTQDEEWHIVLAGESFHEVLILVRVFATQSIVHMGERDGKGIFLLQIREDIEEANTIRSARNAKDKGITVFPEVMERGEVLDTTNESPRLGGEGIIFGALR